MRRRRWYRSGWNEATDPTRCRALQILAFVPSADDLDSVLLDLVPLSEELSVNAPLLAEVIGRVLRSYDIPPTKLAGVVADSAPVMQDALRTELAKVLDLPSRSFLHMRCL